MATAGLACNWQQWQHKCWQQCAGGHELGSSGASSNGNRWLGIWMAAVVRQQWQPRDCHVRAAGAGGGVLCHVVRRVWTEQLFVALLDALAAAVVVFLCLC